MILGIALGVLAALIANEVSDFSPMISKKLVHWAAHQQFPENEQEAAERGEELSAHIDAIPGKLSKLAGGLAFGTSGMAHRARTGARRRHLAKSVKVPATAVAVAKKPNQRSGFDKVSLLTAMVAARLAVSVAMYDFYKSFYGAHPLALYIALGVIALFIVLGVGAVIIAGVASFFSTEKGPDIEQGETGSTASTSGSAKVV